MNKHLVTPEHAAKMKDWLANRGGVAIWTSINLSNPGASWSTPVFDSLGLPYKKPTWEAADEPERIITDIAEIEVSVDKEVKRFRVGVRRGSQGLSFKVTDAGSQRIRREVAKAGKGAYHAFDYDTQEAVIFAPDRIIPLAEWDNVIASEVSAIMTA